MNEVEKIRAELRARYPALTGGAPKPPALRPDPTNIVIGRTADRNPVCIPLRARAEHALLNGAPGSGKSKCMAHVARQIIARGEGLCLLDPHGDVFAELIEEVKETDREVHVIDMSADRLPGFNPLHRPEGVDISVPVGNVMSAISVTREDESLVSLPTTDRMLGGAVLPPLVELGLPLTNALDIIDIKDSLGLRRYAIEHVTDRYTRGELERLHALSQSSRRERDYDQETKAIYNRIGFLIRSRAVRAMLGQTENCLDFGRIMDESGIILVNLAGGWNAYEKDADNLGRLLIRDILFRAKRRTNRNPFTLMMDEAPRFFSADIPVLLAEVRKYGVSVWSGLQYLHQARAYDENVLAALLSATNIKIIFRGRNPEEAELLARATVPISDERLVEALVKPTVVGHRRIRLANESKGESESMTSGKSRTYGRTDTFGVTEGETHTRGHSDMKNHSDVETTTIMNGTAEGTGENSGEVAIPPTSEFMADAEVTRISSGSSSTSVQSQNIGKNTGTVDGTASTDTYSVAESYAVTRSHADSISDTASEAATHGTSSQKGSSEALEPILMNLPTSVHSITTELYKAGQMLMSLPTATGFVNFVGPRGRVATLFTVPPLLRPKMPAPKFAELRARLLARYLTITEALQLIDKREEEMKNRAPQTVKKPPRRIHTRKQPDDERHW